MILVSQVTEIIEGAQFPQTTTEYRCSNQQCQDEREKETASRIKLKKDRDLATEKRALEKLERNR